MLEVEKMSQLMKLLQNFPAEINENTTIGEMQQVLYIQYREQLSLILNKKPPEMPALKDW